MQLNVAKLYSPSDCGSHCGVCTALRRCAALADECGFCDRATRRLVVTVAYLTRSGRRDASAAAAAAGLSRRVSYNSVLDELSLTVTRLRINGKIAPFSPRRRRHSFAKLSWRQPRFSRTE